MKQTEEMIATLAIKLRAKKIFLAVEGEDGHDYTITDMTLKEIKDLARDMLKFQ